MSIRREETRERILAAARKLLAEHGYHGVGIDQIARAAGITRQAVYLHHFKSKTELLLAMVDYVDRVENVYGLVSTIGEAKTPEEVLDRSVRAIAAIAPKVRDVVRVLESARDTDAAAKAAWEDRGRARHANIAGIVRRMKREGALKPEWTVRSATDYIFTMLSPSTYEVLTTECGWTQRQFIERMRAALGAALLVGFTFTPSSRATSHSGRRGTS